MQTMSTSKVSFTPHREPSNRSELVESVLRAVAARRGCNTEEQIDDFLADYPKMINPLIGSPEAELAVARLEQARDGQEKVLIFGDYDCDGITSTVLLSQFLQQAGFKPEKLAWFIPSRFDHGYGLTEKAVQECCKTHAPKLLIAVDCGSVEKDSPDWLAAQGISLVVLDHHGCSKRQSPAAAHINLKLNAPGLAGTNDLCAAGLVFFFCMLLADRWKISAWDRHRAVLLAGLATCADVVPLLGLNRALVKRSLKVANYDRRTDATNGLGKVPGLVALLEKDASKRPGKKPPRWFDEEMYGFFFGPCLNAGGRIDRAGPSVELLLASDEKKAQELAATCVDYNDERKEKNTMVTEEALKQASVQEKQERRVLLVTLDMAERWTQGVIGIAAGRVKEEFHRPIVVCTRVGEGWRGSGRSVKGYNLGEIFRLGVEKGYIQRGGGHAMAGGLQLSEEQRLRLGKWLEDKCTLRLEDLKEEVEYIGKATDFDAIEWYQIFSKLAPFGAENPVPSLSIEEAVRVGEPAVIKRGPKKTRSLSPEQVDWLLKHADAGKDMRKNGKEFLKQFEPELADGNDRPAKPHEDESEDSDPKKKKMPTDIIGLRGFFSVKGSRDKNPIQLTSLRWWKQRALWESKDPCELQLKPKRFKNAAGDYQHALVITQFGPCTPHESQDEEAEA